MLRAIESVRLVRNVTAGVLAGNDWFPRRPLGGRRLLAAIGRLDRSSLLVGRKLFDLFGTKQSDCGLSVRRGYNVLMSAGSN